MSTKSPTPEQLEAAASWLDYYDDDDTVNATACKTVAAWLRAQAVSKELRAAAREHNVPVKRLRAVLAKAVSP